jgi:hypothetical protein
MQHAVLAKAADIMPVHAMSALTRLDSCGQLAVKATDITQNCGGVLQQLLPIVSSVVCIVGRASCMTTVDSARASCVTMSITVVLTSMQCHISRSAGSSTAKAHITWLTQLTL